MSCTVEKYCLYVGALLGVWGIIPFFWCLIILLVCMVCVCWLMVGVLCENCIVDASIKHSWQAALCVWCVVCVCVISFFVFILSSSLVWPPAFLCVVVCVFVIKGAWWMPWHAEPMKDVKGCVKPRGVVN